MTNLTFFDIKPLQNALVNNELIITANQRLCNKIKDAWAEHQQQSGKGAWYTPNIYSYGSWLNTNWFELQSQLYDNTHRLCLLSDDKELWLWQKIIAESNAGKSLLLIKAAAEAAKQAHNVLNAWQISPQDPQLQASPQWKTYLDWQQTFKKECGSRQVISSSLITEFITNAYKNKTLPAHKILHLVGFDEISPVQAQLFEHAATILQEQEPDIEAKSIHRCGLSNQEIEINHAAQWAKAILQLNPNATIGILCPNLPERRKDIERILSTVFEPQFILPDQARYAAPFNFSAGFSLAEQPVIHHAFELLGLNAFRIPFESALSILHSPFIVATETEQEGRLLSELVLRRNNLPDFTISQIKNACEKHDNSPALHQALMDFSELFRQQTRNSKHCFPEEWSKLFLQQLYAMGWPGERRLDSVEYQQVKQWETALQNFSSYNSFTGKIDFSSAVQLLKSLTHNIIFQAKTPDSPIQVLGLLEGASLQFNHLWIMGMEDKAWPAAPRPNPLLPVKLQKDCAMPHASAERELSFATSLMNKITRSARDIVFSYNTGTGDEILRPSKLIEKYPEFSPEQNRESFPEYKSEENLFKLLQQCNNSDTTDTRQPGFAEQVPKVSAEEMKNIGGGSGIFRNQVACPFKAFATHRLKARPLNEPTTNLDAMERGTILHLALEYLWKHLISQENLLNIADVELQDLINKASSHSLEAISRQRPDIIGPVFKKLEIKRLNKLLNKWLDVERNREPFEVVGFEELIETTFEGIPLKLRIDRIDKTSDGAYHLIDYKTGTVKIKNCLPDTFIEPQLPLYAVIENRKNNPVEGIHYGQVNINKCTYDGLPSNLIVDGKSKDSDIPDTELWQDYIKQWQMQLEELAENFITGKAAVDPAPESNPCRYCDLASLCRINELEVNQIENQQNTGGHYDA